MRKISWKSDKLQALLLALLFLLASGSVFFQGLERKAYDWGMRMSHRTPHQEIALIAVDDESIANIGRWPWSREVHARMLDVLAKAKPKVIGSTVLFLEPQADAGLPYINKIAEMANAGRLSGDTATLKALVAQAQQQLNPDATLAASMQAMGNVVIAMPFLLGEPAESVNEPLPAYIARHAHALSQDLSSSHVQPPLGVSAMPPVALIGEAASASGI